MICFVILAHDFEVVLADQIENIKRYNHGCHLVLYNGGTNPHFAKSLGIPICPYSRPLLKGKLGRFFGDTMRWLNEIGADYDYLINLDSDVMFVRTGYEDNLQRWMRNSDLMGINMGIQHGPEEVQHWYPGQSMWKEWDRWQPFFQTDYLGGTLNSMQVYRKSLVNRMLDGINIEWLEQLIESTEVYALEEMLYVTLAIRCGGRHRPYPSECAEFVRLGTNLTVEDIQSAQSNTIVHFIHPIERSMDNAARKSLLEQRDISSPSSLTIVWGCYQGGLETAIYYRLKMLNLLGIDAHVFFYYGGAGLSNFNDIPYRVSQRRDDLIDYIKRNHFKVITFTNTLYNIDILEEADFHGKVVFEFHGYNKYIARELEKINKRQENSAILSIVAPCQYVADIARRHLTDREDLSWFIANNSLDLSLFSKKTVNDSLSHIQIPRHWNNCPLIGWVGRLDSNKNWKLLLRIFRQLKQLHPNVKLLIVSDITSSPYLHLFYKRIASYHLMNEVRVIPNLSYAKMPYYYSLLSYSGGALLSTSYSEGYPYALLEAQACKCPIVCTDIPGNREVVTSQLNGFTFPLDQFQMAVRQLSQLLQEDTLCEALTEHGRQSVCQKNNTHTNVAKFAGWLNSFAAK